MSGLGVAPSEALVVSSNSFDVAGAKSFGLRVAWIERVTARALSQELGPADLLRPLTLFKALRMRAEHLGFEPDHRIAGLSELPALVAKAA